ncbi:MAG: DNA polymerase III subunit beta [Bdellovibrionales bacterium]
MKFTLERNTLLNLVGHAQGVVERRNTIPVLANVLIRAVDGSVSMTATDMEIEMNETIEATVAQTGAVTAPAHTLYDIVRKLPEGAQVELSSTNPNQLTLSSGRSHFKLGCLPIDDFPKMPEGDLQHKFTLATSDLRDLIDRSRFAISNEETRYYLNGIYLHAAKQGDEPVLRAVATDGHRLARVEKPSPKGSQGIPGVIVPRKTVGEVRKLLEESQGEIEIALSESKIRFAMRGALLTSKLIDGTFPEYERVIPSNNDKTLDVDTVALTAAADRVATISSDKTRAIKLSLSPGHLVLSATSPEAGSATEELEVAYEGAMLEVGFNARYLLDVLQQIQGSRTHISLADSAAPAIVKDPEDPSALYVLMPLRV